MTAATRSPSCSIAAAWSRRGRAWSAWSSAGRCAARSLRWLPARRRAWSRSRRVVAGVVGHGAGDVPLRPRLRGGARRRAGRRRRRARVRAARRRDRRALVPRRCARTPAGSASSGRFDVGRRRARPSSQALSDGAARTSERLRESRDREAPARGVPPRAGLLGLPRPAHAAGRAAGDDRGARGRPGRATRSATTGRCAPRSTGWCGWSTTSSSCRGSTPACCRSTLQPVALGDLVSEAHRRRRPGGRGARGSGSAARSSPGVLVRADPAGLSRVVGQPGDERDPAHARGRVGRDHAAGPSHDGVELSVTDGCGGHPGRRPGPGLRRRLAGRATPAPGRGRPAVRRRCRARPGDRRGASSRRTRAASAS